MITQNSKLFVVEFGEPDSFGMINLGHNSNPKPMFVIAESYDDAANKALCYIKDNYDAESAAKGILDEMGNVKPQFLQENQKEFSVKSIKIISDKIIM